MFIIIVFRLGSDKPFSCLFAGFLLFTLKISHGMWLLAWEFVLL